MVIEVPYPSDLRSHPKLQRDGAAGDHIDLVGIGSGDKIVGGIGSSFTKHLVVRSLAENDHTIEGFLDPLRDIRILLDQDHIFLLTDQLFRQLIPYSAGTDDYHFHCVFRYISSCMFLEGYG